MSNNIKAIDTAPGYGGSELLLGRYFKAARDKTAGFKLISKLRPNAVQNEGKDTYTVIKKEIQGSMCRLGANKLSAYLLHRAEDVYNDKIVDALRRLKEEGFTDHIGISIYNIEEGYAALERRYFDYVQMPFSILDQRAAKSGFLRDAKKAGMTIAARSVFLQGLLLMKNEDIPECLQKALPYLKAIDKIISKYGLDRFSSALGFVKQEEEIDYIVFGVETNAQMVEYVQTFHSVEIPKECIRELKDTIDVSDKTILFPQFWNVS
ncbi:aldo/keto reductase [Otoolea muris]|uniref:aldo/keto reductase n=1 Tax=Otoolea muris TaxID=2941515 RepID=UPI00203FB803|nr:aldo/keto reductase [Otoolea muris]